MFSMHYGMVRTPSVDDTKVLETSLYTLYIWCHMTCNQDISHTIAVPNNAHITYVHSTLQFSVRRGGLAQMKVLLFKGKYQPL